MPVGLRPTLELMAEVYALSPQGGDTSPRFTRYVELCRDLHPISHFNPMTGKPEAPATVDALLRIDAEGLANHTLDELGVESSEFYITVATVGAWTDRLFTDVRWRIEASPHIWFWAGEDVSVDIVQTRARAAWLRRRWAEGGVASTLVEYGGQEGVAHAGTLGSVDSEAVATVIDVLRVLGEDTDDHTLIAFTFGDAAAAGGGWRGLGLAGDVGIRVCADLAGADPVGRAIERWLPPIE